MSVYEIWRWIVNMKRIAMSFSVSSLVLMAAGAALAALGLAGVPPLLVYGTSAGEQAREISGTGGQFSTALIEALSPRADLDGQNGISELEFIAYAQYRNSLMNAAKTFAPQNMDVEGRVPENHRLCGSKAYLLSVGVGELPSSSVAKSRASTDAARFSEAYGRICNGNVESHVLTDEKATRNNILNTAQRLFNGSAPDDVLVIFYSGYGQMVDAQTEISAYPEENSADTATLRMTELVERLTGRKADVMILVDASRSNPAAR